MVSIIQRSIVDFKTPFPSTFLSPQAKKITALVLSILAILCIYILKKSSKNTIDDEAIKHALAMWKTTYDYAGVELIFENLQGTELTLEKVANCEKLNVKNSLHLKTISKLGGISELTLDTCGDIHLITDCPSLETLIINTQKFYQLPKIKNCPKLTKLVLKNFEMIQKFSSYTCNTLTSLELSKCTLSDIPPKAQFPNIKQINIQTDKTFTLLDLQSSNILSYSKTDVDFIINIPNMREKLRDLYSFSFNNHITITVDLVKN